MNGPGLALGMPTWPPRPSARQCSPPERPKDSGSDTEHISRKVPRKGELPQLLLACSLVDPVGKLNALQGDQSSRVQNRRDGGVGGGNDLIFQKILKSDVMEKKEIRISLNFLILFFMAP